MTAAYLSGQRIPLPVPANDAQPCYDAARENADRFRACFPVALPSVATGVGAADALCVAAPAADYLLHAVENT